MERRIEEDVDGWPTRPIDGGYDGLRQLATADFSGAVRANGATLFMLNGRIVGIFDGSIDAFDGASGTAHKAPHPALPLLYAMQEQGGETRGKYYTNDTPISEVDQTLSEGGFTGFIELSENVLSGDYYQVYHAGNAMSVAFIGNSGKLVTGDEAFERADDEVGIYSVEDVEVDVRDVPGLGDDSARDDADDAAAGTSGARETTDEDDAADAAGAGADRTESSAARSSVDATDAADTPASDAAAGDDPDRTSERPDPARSASEPGTSGGRSAPAGSSGERDPTADDDATPAQSVSGSQTGGSVGVADEVVEDLDDEPVVEEDDQNAAEAGDRSVAEGRDTDAAAASDLGAAEPVGEPDDESDRDAVAEPATETRSTSTETASDPTERSTPSTDREERPTPSTDHEERSTASGRTSDRRTESVTETEPDAGSSSRSGGTRTASAAVGEATTIPSLDPDRSEEIETTTTTSQTAGSRSRSEPTSSTTTTSREPTEQATEAVEETFEEEVLEREDRIDRLQQRASNLEAERDEIAAERDQLAERVETLEDENESLQAELRQLKREVEDLEAGAATPASDAGVERSGPQQLQPRAALEGTDLFVRYDSKGAATLEDAHDGSASAEEVNENLRLDLHTRFDAGEATVGDEPFQQFLEQTMAYRFVDWLVRKLPYEVRETGQEAAMRDLYDALPEVDRVEFHGVVELTYEENGETVQAEEPFDVVVRDRMGEALFVADLNDSRDPADADMLVDLQSGATRVKETTGALAGAFAVTRSFFDPDALETAGEATSGSLLSRDSRRSYVKVSRKRGYHLCLVEARGDDLHLNVPEL